MRDTGEYLFTSESVSEGHPDKVADRISDTVLDAFLAADPYSRVACETLVTTNRVVLAGETRGPETVTPELLTHLTRMAIRDIGYEQEGFHWANADVAVHLHSQSSDIAQGVDSAGNKDELQVRMDGLRVALARMKAEADGTQPVFPDELVKRHPDLVEAERKNFAARQQNLQATLAVLDEQQRQKTLEVQELQAKQRAVQTQLGRRCVHARPRMRSAARRPV